MAEGWLKVSRKLKDSFAGSSAVSTGVWLHILMRASYRQVLLNNGIRLQEGELLISEIGLATDLQISRKVMRRVLDAFESENMIRVLKRDRNGTKLSVCNWGTYQDSDEPEGHKRNSNGTRTSNERNINEHQKKKTKKVKKDKKGVFTPPTVDEVAAYISEKGYPLDAEAFVASYQRQGWKLNNGRPVSCWKSCVTTWEKNRQKWEEEKQAKETASRQQRIDLRL